MIAAIKKFSDQSLSVTVLFSRLWLRICSDIRAIRMRQEVGSPPVSKCLNIIIHTIICVGSEDTEIQGRAFVR